MKITNNTNAWEKLFWFVLNLIARFAVLNLVYTVTFNTLGKIKWTKQTNGLSSCH